MPAGELAARTRSLFPVLKECVYLNSNSTGAYPAAASEVLSAYWQTLTHWRDEVWERWLHELEQYRRALEAFVGAPKDSVVTDVNLSSLLGRLASCFDYSQRRRRIITTALEFPTMEFIWSRAARAGAKLVVVPSEDGISVSEARLEAAIDDRTLLVCVSHASFITGALLDARRLAAHAHAAGALIAVDGYQSVGAVPIDVDALDVDFLLGGAKKWLCGAPDLGFLYVRPALTERLEPISTGWFAGDDAMSFRPSRGYAEGALRFASGTPAILPALFSRIGLEIVRGVGVDAIRQNSLAQTARIIDCADRLGLTVATPRDPERRGAIVCLRFPGARETTQELIQRGYVCSHRDGLRVAPHFYNSLGEIDAFMEELGAVVKSLCQ